MFCFYGFNTVSLIMKWLDNPNVISALIAAIASLVVTLPSWIISNKQQKRQYIRDFDINMFKEILPVLYSLADEAKKGINGNREGGWKDFEKSIKSAEIKYRSYMPFIQPPIRKRIETVIAVCSNADNADEIDAELTNLIRIVTKYSESLLKRHLI